MLEFSPDWDARFCYLVVLACAVISARIQIYGRLEVLRGKIVYAWSLPSTWLVFTIYLIIPIGLFWFLDRTGAMRDTSVFAALLVGLAYPAVLSGGTTIQPAEGASSVFNWLNKATDALADKVLNLVAVRDRLFRRDVATRAAQHKPALEKLQALALSYAEDPDELEKELRTKKDAYDKALILYDYATNSVEGLRPVSALRSELKLSAWQSPLWRALVARWAYGLSLAALAVTVVLVVSTGPGSRWIMTWRLTKPGVSEVDLNRSLSRLRELLAAGGSEADQLRATLVEALERPGLEVQRSDEILRLLLQFRGAPDSVECRRTTDLLTNALRVSSVDVRSRVHNALLLLAEEHSGPAADLADLNSWKPLATESLIDLERRWRAWQQWWSAAHKPAPPTGG